MLRSGLSVSLYTQVANGTALLQDISGQVENLTFSSVSPGGFGTLTALLRIGSAKAPRLQFGLMARVAVMAGPTCLWLGELMNPAYGLNQADGDYIRISALGLGNALRDDPYNFSYTSQTPQQIAQAQLTFHTSTYKTLAALYSTDNSQLFPDNPTNSITQAYTGRTMEEILLDVALLAGDYAVGTEPDPLQKDFAGFPLGRLYARARNLSNVDYTASLLGRDVYSAEFTPTASRAYNSVAINYANGTSGVTFAQATDSRLNSDLSQGSAPFRYRKYLRDMSGMTLVNSTIANSIASTQLNLFKNPTYTGTVSLRGVRDGNGNALPLWMAQAGKNLFVPELAIQGQQLPTTPTKNTNLFWITQSTYRESANGDQALDMQLGYVPDDAGVAIARLQLASDAMSRSRMVTTVVQAQGAPMYGQYGFEFSNALAGNQEGTAVTFPNRAYAVPTSLTLTSIASSNLGALSVTDLTAYGAFIYANVTAAGGGYARGTYATVGNCLLDVNHESGRFAHHCDVCDQAHQDLSLDAADGHLFVSHLHDHEALTVICPNCAGRVQEGFNLALTEADEQGAWEHRATQARLIRQLMWVHGLALR